MKKSIYLIILACILNVGIEGTAQTLKEYPKIMTVDNRLLFDVRILSIETSGVRITHRSGNEIIEYSNLPDNVLEYLGLPTRAQTEKIARDNERKAREARVQAEARERKARAQAERDEKEREARVQAERALSAIQSQQYSGDELWDIGVDAYKRGDNRLAFIYFFGNRSRGIQSVSSLFSKNVFMCVSHSCRVSSLGGRMSSQDQPGIPSSGVPGISA